MTWLVKKFSLNRSMHGRNLLDDLENACDDSGQQVQSQHLSEENHDTSEHVSAETDKWWFYLGNQVEPDLSKDSNDSCGEFGGNETTNDMLLYSSCPGESDFDIYGN